MSEAIPLGIVDEARRVMDICNACRYCEGICATFQAMSLRRSFEDGELQHLANLCHNCTACYHDCQYAPPHVFDVNVPRSMTELRNETYAAHAWPGFLGSLFHRNGLVVSLATAAALTFVLGAALALVDPGLLFGVHTGPGSFYRVVGHGVMVSVAGASFGFSMLALVMGLRRYWRAAGIPLPIRAIPGAFARALRDAATLRHLGGGHGEGCNTRDEGYSNQRRWFHQATAWGFVLCFLATCVATVYDYGLGRVAPYPFLSVPVLLGTVGGLGLVAGPLGLIWVKLQSDSRPMVAHYYGMDYAFLLSLTLVSGTGLLLLTVRETSAMGLVLVIHLGFVMALLVMLPYSKFVHGIYRFAALVRFAAEYETGSGNRD